MLTANCKEIFYLIIIFGLNCPDKFLHFSTLLCWYWQCLTFSFLCECISSLLPQLSKVRVLYDASLTFCYVVATFQSAVLSGCMTFYLVLIISVRLFHLHKIQYRIEITSWGVFLFCSILCSLFEFPQITPLLFPSLIAYFPSWEKLVLLFAWFTANYN